MNVFLDPNNEETNDYTAIEWGNIWETAKCEESIKNEVKYKLLKNWIPIISLSSKIKKEYLKEQQNTLIHLLKTKTHLEDIIEQSDFTDGIIDYHHLKNEAERALPLIDAIIESQTFGINANKREIELGLKLTKGRNGSNRSNAYVDKVFKNTAESWEGMGRKVDQSKQCKKFFEAACKPIYFNDLRRRQYNLGWTENTVDTYIKKWMKKKNTTGARGPKSKNRI